MLSFLFFISYIFSSSPLLMSLQAGMSPSMACRNYKLRDEKATLANVSDLYNLLTSSSGAAAYLQGWNGDNSGWVMTKSGQMIPYRQYPNPIYYVFCDQSSGPFKQSEQIVEYQNEPQPFDYQRCY